MDIKDVLLLVLVIIVIWLLVKDTKLGDMIKNGKKEEPIPIPEVIPDAEGVSETMRGNPAKMALKKKSYEDMAANALKENQEYFSACQGHNDQQKVLDCVCDPSESYDFAKWDYGSPNHSYQDYVASQAVDAKVILNHAQFVRDRQGLGPEGEFVTGRTYSPDSHDSYDPVPWVGIRGRPQYVEQCNPTQVPDIDTNLFKGNRAFCFWT